MMSSRSRLLKAGAAVLLLSLAGGCVAPSGLGAFLVLSPRWMKRETPAALTPLSDADATRKVDAMRVMRAAEGVRNAEWLRVKALSAARETAVAGTFRAAWAHALPKARLVYRFWSSTGHDPMGVNWGDVSRPRRQRNDVSLRYDDGTVKRVPVSAGAPWVGYLAHGGYALKRIGVTNPPTLD